MDMRNWADLNTNCLINIFTRVGLHDTRSLIRSLQFVCKSWFRATCDPCCWETLNFSHLCCTNDVIFAVQRSQGCATTIICNVNYLEEILPYIIQGCPLLKVLEISGLYAMYERAELLTSGLSKWKNLEKFKFIEMEKSAANSLDMRNWADLNTDCLINIFTRVGVDDTRSLIRSLQFVCKSWFRATCDPCFWETLYFSELCCTNDVIFAERSQGCATTIISEVNYFEEILPYIIEGCPLLKVLEISGLPGAMIERDEPLLISGLSKLKNLEKFKLTCCKNLEFLIEAIGVNCKNLIELDFSFTEFENEDIQAISTFLPRLKSLTMTGSNLQHDQLVAVLTTCNDLEYLDVNSCWGFVPDDEIYRLASHIKHFSCDNCWTTSIGDMDIGSYLRVEGL